ncbi:MAG: HEPN domain-containing protein [bacterium]
MTDEQRNIIELRLERANESLDAAKVLEDNHHYIAAVNRLYYACFYAVTALLETRKLSSSKHSGVISLFNRYFVKTDIVSKELGKFYKRLFGLRLDGDYADFVDFSVDEVDDLYQSAADFVEKISQIVKKELQE